MLTALEQGLISPASQSRIFNFSLIINQLKPVSRRQPVTGHAKKSTPLITAKTISVMHWSGKGKYPIIYRRNNVLYPDSTEIFKVLKSASNGLCSAISSLLRHSLISGWRTTQTEHLGLARTWQGSRGLNKPSTILFHVSNPPCLLMICITLERRECVRSETGE